MASPTLLEDTVVGSSTVAWERSREDEEDAEVSIRGAAWMK